MHDLVFEIRMLQLTLPELDVPVRVIETFKFNSDIDYSPNILISCRIYTQKIEPPTFLQAYSFSRKNDGPMSPIL